MLILEKDKKGLIASKKLKLVNGKYFEIYLWKSRKGIEKNTDAKSVMKSGETVEAIVCFNDKKRAKLLGEIHFIKGKCNTETIAHELIHILFYRLQCMSPKVNKVFADCRAEEFICREFGRWFGIIFEFVKG